MRSQSPAIPRLVAMLLLLTFWLPALAAKPAQSPASEASEPPPVVLAPGQELPSQEQIQERIAALEQASSLNETIRNQALSLYRAAAERLAAAQNYAKTAERYRQALSSAPEQTAQLRERLSQARAAPSAANEPLLARGEARAEFKQLLIQKRAEYTALQNRLKELDEQLRAQLSRPLAAREELAAARQRRDEADAELQNPLAESENERLRDARGTALIAQRHAATAQIDMLEQELLSHDARLALLNAQRELLAFQLQEEAARLKRIQELANLQSRAEAAQAAESAARAKREAGGAFSVLLDVAQINAELSQQLSELVVQIERTSSSQDRIASQLAQINKSYQSTRRQLEIAGLNEALGEALRRERQLLPDLNDYERSAKRRQQRITDARLAQFRIEQQRREFAPIQQQLKMLMETRVEQDLEPDTRAQVERELRLLLEDRVSLMDELAVNYARYIDLLADLDRDQSELARQAAQYATLLDESLFWIASSAPLDLAWLKSLTSSAGWLADSDNWREVMVAARKGLDENLPLTGFVLLLMAVLLRARRALRQRLHAAATRIGRVHSDRFTLTAQVLLMTPLLALPLPLLLYLLGWLILQPFDASAFAAAAGHGLQNAALVALFIDSMRQLCRREGLVQAHFQWSEHSRRVLWHNLSWLLLIALPVTFLISITEWQAHEAHRESLGRAAFLLGTLMLAVFSRRVLHPQRGAVTGLRAPELHGRWWWLRYLGYPLAVTLPLLLGAMAAYGYYYTALQLQSRLFTTGALLVTAGIAANLALRWLKLMERRLALTRARARRAAMRAARQAGASLAVAAKSAEPQIDLATIEEQSRGLLHLTVGIVIVIGLWMIWVDLMPALNILRDIVLWQHASPDGERLIPITLVDVILASSIGAGTMLAARNLPGILEISILPRLAIDAGTRYAITAISRYTIIIIGLVAAISLLGISWSKAQWLVAALGLGLGFGLQEIFANFVSGLIVLFERPIRVGDTITVGELSGTVTRIRIRATTVIDPERREIIIPNKTFITERLVNWTLSDPITRVTVKIGVPYESDPELVTRLMMGVAHTNPRVMDEPEPSVFLTGFGDSALTFELRAYVRELADRMPLAHELHVGIVSALREHGIEIPYPQRSLYVRNMQAVANAGDKPAALGR